MSEMCRKQEKEYNLYCFHCYKYIWPVYAFPIPYHYLKFYNSYICGFKSEMIQMLMREYTPKELRIIPGVYAPYNIEIYICIWCDKVFLNNSRGTRTKAINVHIKIGHEKLFYNFQNYNCECKNPLVVTDLKQYQMRELLCPCKE